MLFGHGFGMATARGAVKPVAYHRKTPNRGSRQDSQLFDANLDGLRSNGD